MTLHSYMKQIDGEMPRFTPSTPEGVSTSTYWTIDGSQPKPSESVTASFEQIDDYAESLGLNAWYNGH